MDKMILAFLVLFFWWFVTGFCNVPGASPNKGPS